MKATIEYNLPDDQIEFELATSAHRMHSVLWDLDQWLRSKLKYQTEKMTDEEEKAYAKVREHLHELMGDYNINLD